MENSKKLLKEAKIYPRLKLAVQVTNTSTGKKSVQGTGPHRVKLVKDKLSQGTEFETGKEREEVHYLVEENGELKKYTCPRLNKQGELHYLVQRFAEVEEGQEIMLEYKRKGVKGYIEVTPLGSTEDVEVDEHDEEELEEAFDQVEN